MISACLDKTATGTRAQSALALFRLHCLIILNLPTQEFLARVSIAQQLHATIFNN